MFVECWFYVLFPLVLSAYRKKPIVLISFAMLLSVLQGAFVFFIGGDIETKTFYYEQPTSQLIFFVLGMALSDKREKIQSFGLSRIWFFIGCMLTVLSPYFIKSMMLQFYLSVFSIGLMVATYPEVRRPLWIGSALRWVGKRSYSLYLLHVPLLAVTEYFFPDRGYGVGIWGVQIALALGVSAVTWGVIEAPGIRLGRRFT